jgi:hypothetical protein
MTTSSAREYNIWAMMRQRCTNPNAANYVNYGGRGITVDPRWKKFAAFIADMGPAPSPKHTLNRRDNDGPYSPENCVWSDVETQQNNRRNNVFVEAFGQRLTVAQWARKTGLTRDMIRHRIFVMGMAPEEALKAKRMSHVQFPVEQLTLEGEVVCRYSSLAELGKLGKFNKAAVHMALVGRSKTSGGFRWRYVLCDESNTGRGTL